MSTPQICKPCEQAISITETATETVQYFPDNAKLRVQRRFNGLCRIAPWQDVVQASESCWLCWTIATWCSRYSLSPTDTIFWMKKRGTASDALHWITIKLQRHADGDIDFVLDFPIVVQRRSDRGQEVVLSPSNRVGRAKKSRMPYDAFETLFLQNPLWLHDGLLSFDDRVSNIRRLLEQCRHQHKECTPVQSFLPTRLIEICHSSELGFRLRLVQAQSLRNKDDVMYATLSYCWGVETSSLLKMTVDNNLKLQSGIEWDLVPMTIKDAVRLTHALGLTYIWVDALCIMQGHVEDWENESAVMAQTYGGSQFTIAASYSSSATDGLCLDLATPSVVIDQGDRSFHVHLHPDNPKFGDLSSRTLYTRGWVLQELVLSKRVIHLDDPQFYWHCRHHMVHENGMHVLEDASGPLEREQLRQTWLLRLRQDWHELVNIYTTLQFTKREDRTAAIAGMTVAFTEATSKTPMLGLWLETLHHDLGWSIACDGSQHDDSDDNHLRSPIPRLPSWTWLYWDCEACWLSLYNDTTDFDDLEDDGSLTPLLDVRSSQLEWSGVPLASSVRNCKLEIAAYVEISPLRQWSRNSERSRLWDLPVDGVYDLRERIEKEMHCFSFAGFHNWAINHISLDHLRIDPKLWYEYDWESPDLRVLALSIHVIRGREVLLGVLIVEKVQSSDAGIDSYKRIGIARLHREVEPSEDGMTITRQVRSSLESEFTMLELV